MPHWDVWKLGKLSLTIVADTLEEAQEKAARLFGEHNAEIKPKVWGNPPFYTLCKACMYKRYGPGPWGVLLISISNQACEDCGTHVPGQLFTPPKRRDAQ